MLNRKLGILSFLITMSIALGGCSFSGEENTSPGQVAHFTITNEHCVLEDQSRLAIFGTLTNDTSVPVSKVVIRYDIYGEDGNQTIDFGTESANEWELYYVSLNPGESVDFRVSGEISERTNGVASFEFDNLRCVFDEPNEYKKNEVTGYVNRAESEGLVEAAIGL